MTTFISRSSLYTTRSTRVLSKPRCAIFNGAREWSMTSGREMVRMTSARETRKPCRFKIENFSLACWVKRTTGGMYPGTLRYLLRHSRDRGGSEPVTTLRYLIFSARSTDRTIFLDAVADAWGEFGIP